MSPLLPKVVSVQLFNDLFKVNYFIDDESRTQLQHNCTGTLQTQSQCLM